ncbi:MAG: PKD domain-containing protein [Bacteroidota bacterium]
MKRSFLPIILLFISSHFYFAQDSISVLWIGNSYTYVNDLPSMTSQLATSLGDKITFDSKTNGGYTFANQWGDALTFTKIKSKPWDFVVLQAQSQEPSFPTSQVNSSTLPNAIKIADSIYTNRYCSQVMYFMTWGRENGDAQWDSINTFNKMNGRLRKAYLRFMDSTEASMSAVGSAWRYVRENHPSINLYQADGSHPSVEGSYLAANVFYTSLFRKSPVGASYLGGLDVTTAGILQNAAAFTVLDSLAFFALRSNEETAIAKFNLIQNSNDFQFVNESWRGTSYEWNFGDGTFSTDENPIHTYSAVGNFQVQLIANNDCGSDTIVQQVQVTTAGLSLENDDFKIHTLEEGLFKIIGISEIENIALYSGDGRILKNELFNYESNELVLNLQGESKGLYFLIIDGVNLKISN